MSPGRLFKPNNRQVVAGEDLQYQLSSHKLYRDSLQICREVKNVSIKIGKFWQDNHHDHGFTWHRRFPRRVCQ